MSAGEETARTVLQLTSKAAVMTLQSILSAISKVKNTGEQSLQSLSAKNVSLDKIPVSNVDIRQMRDLLKEYGIDFAVVRNKGTQDFTLYFKGTDTVAITSALEEVVKTLDIDKEKGSDLSKPELSKKLESAREQTQKSHIQEKTADRSADIPKPKGTEQNL